MAGALRIICKYCVEQEISKNERRVYTLFVDLKVRFEMGARKGILQYFSLNGVSENLIDKIDEIYEQT